MKITQETKAFKPITITIETKQELEHLLEILDNYDSNKTGDCDAEDFSSKMYALLIKMK